MRQAYDPGEMPQVCYKHLQTGRLMLARLNCETSENMMIRPAMHQFQQQMDLVDAVDKWKETKSDKKTWDNFKLHFSREIKRNRTRKGSMKQLGIVNAVQEQVEINRTNQQLLTENSIE